MVRAMNRRAKARIKVDLHCHSLYSDGIVRPEVLAQLLARAGVKCAALVDHDTTAGLQEFHEALSRHGIGYVSGVEMTLLLNARELHILGYGINPEHQGLQETLATIRRRREVSIPVLWRDIKDWWSKVFWTFPRYTFTEKLAGTPDEFYYIETDLDSLNSNYAIWVKGEGLPTHLHQRVIDIVEGIEVIHQAGGLAFLAHPLVHDRDLKRLDYLIGFLHNHGLDGVEAFYAPYNRGQREGLVAIAEAHNLLVSCGSDYHGLEHRGGHQVGIDMPREWWERLRRALRLNVPKH